MPIQLKNPNINLIEAVHYSNALFDTFEQIGSSFSETYHGFFFWPLPERMHGWDEKNTYRYRVKVHCNNIYEVESAYLLWKQYGPSRLITGILSDLGYDGLLLEDSGELIVWNSDLIEIVKVENLGKPAHADPA